MGQANSLFRQQLTACRASLNATAATLAALDEALKLAEAACQEPEQKQGCPHCGSPNFIEMPSMAGKEKQCQDCGRIWE